MISRDNLGRPDSRALDGTMHQPNAGIWSTVDSGKTTRYLVSSSILESSIYSTALPTVHCTPSLSEGTKADFERWCGTVRREPIMGNSQNQLGCETVIRSPRFSRRISCTAPSRVKKLFLTPKHPSEVKSLVVRQLRKGEHCLINARICI